MGHSGPNTSATFFRMLEVSWIRRGPTRTLLVQWNADVPSGCFTWNATVLLLINSFSKKKEGEQLLAKFICIVSIILQISVYSAFKNHTSLYFFFFFNLCA